MRTPTKDALGVFAIALAVRAAVVVWAAPRFAPVADAHYYHVLATRLAAGQGYTWLWPDGAVTHAAHYPVGYPALLALFYAIFGSSAWVGMALNAVVGSAAAPAAHALAGRFASRRGALVAGLLVALHPGLVLYTPALMTEGFVAALIVIAAWLASKRGLIWVLPLGALIGVATLIRPQTIVLAPILGLALGRGVRQRLGASALSTLLSIAIVAPWTTRNCARMDRCVVVSANGGWNLLIGATPEARGTFAPVADAVVPPECREVFGEAAKDVCFGRSAIEKIRAAPLAWLARGPQKLYYTFDVGGGAGWYLHASSPESFSARTGSRLTVLELVWQRLAVLLGIVALAGIEGPRRRARRIILAGSAVLLLTPAAWVSYLGLAVAGVLLGPRLVRHVPALGAVAVVGTTALTHLIFFGAGRYALVCYAAVAALSGCALRRSGSFLTGGEASRDTAASEEPDAADRD